MKIFTLRLIILLSFIQTAGATVIDTIYINYPGIVGGAWTPEHRYIANYDINVPYDSVLTVNQGVYIEIKNGFSFNVKGQLIANGSQNDLIHITPFHDDGWTGINFSTPSGETVVKTSQLSFIEINCGNYPGSEAIMIGKHQVNSISNLTINGAQNAITISGQAIINSISNCSIGNVSQGIAYKFCDAVTQILIEGCNFNNISDKAIFITDNGAYQLDQVTIQGCVFDNSNLGGNNSVSAIYISFNDQLESVSLASNNIKSFALKDNLSAGIYINDNPNLNEISLSHNKVISCGGSAPDQPVADFGGLYIDKCSNVSLQDNEFSQNTGVKSGAGFIHCIKMLSSDNSIHNNQNSTYSGNDYFAGAVTFIVSGRVEMNRDNYAMNSSAKSGGAFVILADNSNPVDLIFNAVNLSSNIAAYNGGAALINAAIDTLKISASVFNGNSASSGGGCFSLISNSFNILNLESNTIQDNFVSKIANGGFLYITHIPQEITPVYGSLRFHDNFIQGMNHADQNYSILYATINSFPSSISITGDSVINSYPVSSSLYVLEHPLAQSYQAKDQIALTLSGNYFSDNRCPVFYLANDSATVTSDIHGNYVEGSQGFAGTFVNVRCNKVPDLWIHSDQYLSLADTSSRSGGAVLFRTFKEIGLVTLDSIVSEDCYSAGGNGGHISLISGSSDPSMIQKLILKNSFMNNESSGTSTGGSGGGIYYTSPGNVDSLVISNSYFTDLTAETDGGALFVNSREINSNTFQGAHFSNVVAAGTGGAVYLNAGNGNIKDLSAFPFDEDYTSFALCRSGSDGGAMYVKASKEIGPVLLESVESADCRSLNGNGGHIALISGSSDASLSQDLIINNSTFTTSTPSDPNGGDGGAIYYHSPGNLDSLRIVASHFTGLKSAGAGGAIFVDAKDVNVFNIMGTDFGSDLSTASDAGALYVNASNGNIKGISIRPYNGIVCMFDGCSALNNGGAINLKASGEIGPVLIDSVEFTNCHSIEGNGGALSLISDSSDPAQAQNLVIQNSGFSNTSLTTGGNGGGVYYQSPGILDSLTIRLNQFSGLQAQESGGAIFMDIKEIDRVNILGSLFISNASGNSYGGGIYINASDGNVRNLMMAPFQGDTTHFTSCNSKSGGGAVFIKASREVGPSYFEYVRAESCNSSNGDGGQFALISAGSDPGLQQKLIITNSTFSNPGNLSGGNGGAIYFDSPANLLDSLFIQSGMFSDLNVKKKAGALFVNTKEINVAGILGSRFTLNSSNDSVGGSIYVNAGSGNINNLFIRPLIAEASAFSSCSSKLSGGALYFSASNEIGTAVFDSVSFDDCSSVSGNGGSLFMSAGKFSSISISSSRFNSSRSLLSGGAAYLKSSNGMLNGDFSSNRFLNCTSYLSGGVFYIEDNNYDNSNENLVWSENNYRKEPGVAGPETGGAIYCKGIKTVTIVGDSVMNQSSSLKGGFLYLEKVYQSVLEGVYANGNSSGKGGVVYHQGDESNPTETSGIYNSNFLFNSADLTGGCFYITDIDSVKMGKDDNKNVFVANQTLQESSNDVTVGGGVFYIQNASSLDLNTNSFYVNNSRNNGGTGIIDHVASYLAIENNVFLTNKARIGGTFTFLNDLPDGLVANNKFYHNSSTLNGGALFFYQASEGNFVIRDNTFYNNSTSIAGGAITTYRPLNLVRNLFRENSLNVIDPINNNGTAVSLNDSGIQSLIKNCVFDKNSGKIENVAGIYFDNSTGPLPDPSIANCTFFNHNENFRSVFNAGTQDTVHVINSIFDISAKKLRENVRYFNETVKATYCDMIHSKDTSNHNYDEYFVFNNGDYYFDSLQPAPFDTVQSFPINKGNPDPVYYDKHLPAGYWGRTNDLGVSGGPDNPDSNSTFLFHEPPNLPAKFDVVVRSSHCFDYTFECLGDSIENYDYFYWFMPDTILKTEGTGLRVMNYTFKPDAEGNLLITVLGHASDFIDIFGYGQDTVNLDIIRINSLGSTTGSNTVSVPSTPFQFGITASIYVAENADDPTSQWSVLAASGIEYSITQGLTSCGVSIQKMTQPSGSLQVEYMLHSCGRTRRDTVTLQLTTVNWGSPEISFYPSVDDIPNSTDSIEVKFDHRMTDFSGTACEDLIPENFLVIGNPCPDQIKFNIRVICGPNDTRFILIPVDINTGIPTAMCDGAFNIKVLGQNLLTENYQLPGVETDKPYFLDINEPYYNNYIKVYPNPFRDIIQINFSAKDDYTIEITDLTGHVQKSGYFGNVSEATLNLGGLSEGMHLLQVTNPKNQRLIMKLVKLTH